MLLYQAVECSVWVHGLADLFCYILSEMHTRMWTRQLLGLYFFSLCFISWYVIAWAKHGSAWWETYSVNAYCFMLGTLHVTRGGLPEDFCFQERWWWSSEKKQKIKKKARGRTTNLFPSWEPPPWRRINFRSVKAILQSSRNMWKFRIDRRQWLPICQTWAKKVQYLAVKMGASGLQQLFFWTVWFMIVPVDYSWLVLLYK